MLWYKHKSKQLTQEEWHLEIFYRSAYVLEAWRSSETLLHPPRSPRYQDHIRYTHTSNTKIQIRTADMFAHWNKRLDRILAMAPHEYHDWIWGSACASAENQCRSHPFPATKRPLNSRSSCIVILQQAIIHLTSRAISRSLKTVWVRCRCYSTVDDFWHWMLHGQRGRWQFWQLQNECFDFRRRAQINEVTGPALSFEVCTGVHPYGVEKYSR